MPDAAPRWSGGTLFMMPVMFGAENRPMPMPFRAAAPPNTGKREVRGQRHEQAEAERRARSMPPVVNARAP